MKKSLLFIAACTMFAGSAFAQTAAPAAAPAAATGVCKDGSAFSAATTKGACRGHGGIDKKAGDAAAAPAAAPAPVAKDTAPAKSTTAAPAPAKTPAAGGGAGKVWANDITKVYHCQGDKYYGTTKKGEYMTEADAKTKGFHADHGNACAK